MIILETQRTLLFAAISFGLQVVNLVADTELSEEDGASDIPFAIADLMPREHRKIAVIWDAGELRVNSGTEGPLGLWSYVMDHDSKGTVHASSFLICRLAIVKALLTEFQKEA